MRLYPTSDITIYLHTAKLIVNLMAHAGVDLDLHVRNARILVELGGSAHALAHFAHGIAIASHEQDGQAR